jgi:hypothetical protein
MRRLWRDFWAAFWRGYREGRRYRKPSGWVIAPTSNNKIDFTRARALQALHEAEQRYGIKPRMN